MRIFRLQNLFSCNYNELNQRSLSCSQVISITVSVKIQLWSNLKKIVMSHARAERYACSMMTILMKKKG